MHQSYVRREHNTSTPHAYVASPLYVTPHAQETRSPINKLSKKITLPPLRAGWSVSHALLGSLGNPAGCRQDVECA
eukprot:4548147-Pyramimonas_sp.AAC.2